MATEASSAPKSRWWRKPLSWFAEESFWRDITKSAVSTGVVALIAYLYALAAGYVATPSGLAVVVIALSTLSLMLLVLAVRAVRLRSFAGTWPLFILSLVLYLAMATIDLTRGESNTGLDRFASTWAMTLALVTVGLAVVITVTMKRGHRILRSSPQPARRSPDNRDKAVNTHNA